MIASLLSPFSAWRFLFSLVSLPLALLYLRWRFHPLRKLPGPRGASCLFGETLTILKGPPFWPYRRWWKDHNYAPVMAVPSVFAQWFVLVLDPEILKRIFSAPSTKEPVQYPKHMWILRYVIGEHTLPSLEGSKWARHRRILQPGFQNVPTKEALSAAAPPRVNKLLESWKRAEGRAIDLPAHMKAITIDVMGEALFAHNFQALDKVAEWSRNSGGAELDVDQDSMLKYLNHAFSHRNLIIAEFLHAWKMEWIRRFIDPTGTRMKQLLNEKVDMILQASMKNSSSPDGTKSVLRILLDAMGKDHSGRNSLTLQEIKDEMKLMIVAGYETTSKLLTYAFYALGKHSNVQRLVLDDIEKHAPADRSVAIGLDAVAKMDYLLAFIQECLRLYPPTGVVIRFTTQSEVWNGHAIPAGTKLIIPVSLVHRHPGYWPNPEAFLPERWLQDSKARHHFCFVPFAAGGRNCLGEKFSRFEVQLILANLIRHFKIELSPETQDARIDFQPAGPDVKLQIVVTER